MPTIIVEFEVSNVKDAQDAMEGNAGLLEHLTKDAQSHGATHHDFYTDGQTILAIDEWDSEADFHSFFDANLDIKSITEQAGVRKEPKVTVLTPMQVAGSF